MTGTPSVEPNTTTTSSFAIPALGGAVTVFITSAAWPIVGQTVEINDGTGTNFGFFEITSVTSSTQIQVTNRGYLGNPVTGTMGSGATVILTSPGLMTSTQPGFAPSGTGVAGQFLNGTGAFSVLPSNTVAQAGIVSTAPNDLNKVYRGDASWAFVGPTTELNGSFAVPVIGGSIALTIAAATWPVVGQTVWISDGTHVGFFQITTVTDSTHITVKNMGYLGNSISGSWANASLVQLAGPSIATATQPGDLPAPPNNTYQFLNGQAVFVTPVLTYAGFVPYDNIPYSTTYPAFNVRGSYGLPVLDCVKLVETDCLFSAVMPQNANLGSGLTIIVKWTAHVATIGNVVWQAQYARLNGSIATASFSGAATQTTTTSGTIDSIATTSIAIASTTITAGDLYLIMVSRLGANVSDTMADTAELLSVEVRSSGT